MYESGKEIILCDWKNFSLSVGCNESCLCFLVFPDAHNVFACASGNEFITRKLTNNLDWWISFLFLDQFVSFFRDGALDSDSIHSFLVELFAELEFDRRILECRRSFDDKCSIVLDCNLNGRWDCARNFASHVTDICWYEAIMDYDDVKRLEYLI